MPELSSEDAKKIAAIKLSAKKRHYEACGHEIPANYGKDWPCPECKERIVSRNSSNLDNAYPSGLRQIFGLIGSVVLFVGVFTPIVSVPIMGNMNYFQNGKGDGTIILILAVISFVLVLARKYKGLWFTGIGSLGVMLFTFVKFQSKMSQARADMELKLAGNPFRGLADLTMQSVQFQWGWAFLIVGVALVITAAAMKNEK